MAWIVEVADKLFGLFGLPLDALGIRPRNLFGLVGVFLSPWLHGDWGHLLNNTIAFLGLGFLMVIAEGKRFFENDLSARSDQWSRDVADWSRRDGSHWGQRFDLRLLWLFAIACLDGAKTVVDCGWGSGGDFLWRNAVGRVANRAGCILGGRIYVASLAGGGWGEITDF